MNDAEVFSYVFGVVYIYTVPWLIELRAGHFNRCLVQVNINLCFVLYFFVFHISACCSRNYVCVWGLFGQCYDVKIKP